MTDIAVTPLSDSLVICTKDRPREIERCLSSLLRLDDLPTEILVVDSSGDQETRDIALKFRTDGLARVKWVQSPPGLTRQRNLGVRLCDPRSSIIHFIDDDTALEPKYFSELRKAFASNDCVVGVGGRDELLPEYRLTRIPSHRRSMEGKVSRAGVNMMSRTIGDGEPREVEWLSGCSMSFRRSLFGQITFDERRRGNGPGEDVDFCLRALKYGSLLWCPGAVLRHLQSPINRSSSRRAGVESAIHRRSLARDRLHEIGKFRVLFGILVEGSSRVVLSPFIRSRNHFEFGFGLLKGLMTALPSG